MSLFERLAKLRAEREAETKAHGSPTPGIGSMPKEAGPREERLKVPAYLFGGNEVRTECGPFCLRQLRVKEDLDVCLPPPELITRNLRLLWGVGPVTERALKAQGLGTVYDLCNHPRWAEEARRVLSLIRTRRAAELRRRGARDVELLGLFAPYEVVCLDIETTGLWANQPLFLVGVLCLDQGELVLKQLLARHYQEERALLTYLSRLLAQAQVIVTFNGKRFDLPYIEQRLVYHNLPPLKELFQVDLYFHARRLPQDLPNRRLVTLEEYLLGKEREGDVPGYLVPTLYHRFVRTGETQLLQPVLEHNVQDVISLARLLYLVGHRQGEVTGGAVG